jgi:hypothetical protein
MRSGKALGFVEKFSFPDCNVIDKDRAITNASYQILARREILLFVQKLANAFPPMRLAQLAVDAGLSKWIEDNVS